MDQDLKPLDRAKEAMKYAVWENGLVLESREGYKPV
jgi:hypothetical protein